MQRKHIHVKGLKMAEGRQGKKGLCSSSLFVWLPFDSIEGSDWRDLTSLGPQGPLSLVIE